jgi:hypothetical protein
MYVKRENNLGFSMRHFGHFIKVQYLTKYINFRLTGRTK